MNTMETDKGQGDLIGTWYQEKPKNSDEFCIMSAMTAEMTLNTERHLWYLNTEDSRQII